ncbi:MAG: ABC transporter permease [Planctomycetota bacterium]|nr:ABC transporter permease [Planctomycetota bacterium]MDA1138361.1 ABC transporter permease [Planctomycetota bacterium]
MAFNLIARLGDYTLSRVNYVGRMGQFLIQALLAMLTPPIKIWRVIKRIHFIGWQSMTVILLTGGFTGMVLALQGFHSLRRVGSEAFLGPLVALTLIRELGPVIAALMVTGRAGSAITAEIGVMRISDQIDAIELMGLNPMRYLVVPNLIAAIISMPLLAGIFDLVGIYGGYLVGVKILGLSPGTYFGEITTYLDLDDILGGLYKALSFGVIMAWICCFKGYNTHFGAEGVSRSTTEAVVLTSVLILVWDYFMTAAVF